MSDETVVPDAVVTTDEEEPEEEASQAISQPAKLIRIASMTRAMLEEVRQAPIDERGLDRLSEVYKQSIEELREVLSAELVEEFDQIMVPLDSSDTSAAEIRVAQAQLIGWLEGLFHGIQASMFSQQVAAQAQMAEMQRRSLTRPQRPESGEGGGLYL